MYMDGISEEILTWQFLVHVDWYYAHFQTDTGLLAYEVRPRNNGRQFEYSPSFW
jgi:hypothetical protein